MKFTTWITAVAFLLLFNYCSVKMKSDKSLPDVRGLADTVGFAHLDWQMDTVIERINRNFGEELNQVKQPDETAWKIAICPHDDYAYSSWLYPAVLKNIKAKTVVIFGVAHKAKQFNLENRIVFDSFKNWHGPYGNVKISPLREKIKEKLPGDLYVVHDSMQTVEHSVEALVPFLQFQDRSVEIVSILVPYMPMEKINIISDYLSKALSTAISEENLDWGKDIALLITSDAVHYGDEEWGGSNYAPFGTDSLGYANAVDKEHRIVQECFTGDINEKNAERFFQYTLRPGDFREYQWTWCGRYSIPFGLQTAVKLQAIGSDQLLTGIPLGYQNSIDHPELKVDDIRMGKTAVANRHHWVGYAAVGFN